MPTSHQDKISDKEKTPSLSIFKVIVTLGKLHLLQPIDVGISLIFRGQLHIFNLLCMGYDV